MAKTQPWMMVWCITHARHLLAYPYTTIGGSVKEQPSCNSTAIELSVAGYCSTAVPLDSLRKYVGVHSKKRQLCFHTL